MQGFLGCRGLIWGSLGGDVLGERAADCALLEIQVELRACYIEETS